jgi:hypothetical protein
MLLQNIAFGNNKLGNYIMQKFLHAYSDGVFNVLSTF